MSYEFDPPVELRLPKPVESLTPLSCPYRWNDKHRPEICSWCSPPEDEWPNQRES